MTNVLFLTFNDLKGDSMGTQSAWNTSDLQGTKPRKLPHRVALVSPRMDVDVTGFSFKNVRTHLIDNPRDSGLKHREQLWNFQQSNRGAKGKLKDISPASPDGEAGDLSLNLPSHKSQQQVPGDRGATTQNSAPAQITSPADNLYSHTVRSSTYIDQTSLTSRFQKRLRPGFQLASMRPADHFESARRRVFAREPKEEEGSRPNIQRMYSSGLVVKNNLYNQIRHGDSDERDDRKILEAIEKYGSLEKLPDIPYSPGTLPGSPQYRYLKSLSMGGRRTSEHTTQERRFFGLRRSLTNISDIDTTKKRLVIVSKNERNLDRMVHCLDSENDDEDEEDENDDDEEDECESEPRSIDSKQVANRDYPDHIAIRENITHVHTQDDLVLLENQNHDRSKHKNGYVTERTFYATKRNINLPRRGDRAKENSDCSLVTASSTCSSDSSRSRHKNDYKTSRESKQTKKSSGKKNQKDLPDTTTTLERADSNESLDIPDDRYGPTTHSIDKKLSIRKPWEWRPSPYRWIDKPYVRESDKPYIERVINRGDVIDEFNYDSYARTKPLKLQSFPEGAGYKDRYGNLR